jgi:Alternative complex III, ActD subunit
MSGGIRIKAVYEHLDCLLTGVERLKQAGVSGYVVQAPLPRHEIEQIMFEGAPAPVRWWTLLGAVTGLTTGFLLTSLTAADWPMINPGGKPVVSIVPFTVILFECTILFGGLATLLGLLFHAGLPAIGLDRALRDPRFTDASFGITFPSASSEDRERITALLEGTGAVEITSGAETIYEVPNA